MSALQTYQQFYKKRTELEKIRMGMKFGVDPDFRNKVMNHIADGVEGKRSDKILASHFALRSFIEFPMIFREPLSQGKEAFEKSLEKSVTTIQKVFAYNADSALPDLVTRNYQSFATFDNFDMRAFEAFRRQEFEPNRTALELPKSQGRVDFLRHYPGQRVELSDFSADFVELDTVDYGGGMQWSKSLLRNRQFSRLIDLTRIFRDSIMAHQSEEVYRTLGGAAFANFTPFVAGANVLEGIILTINQMAEDLSNDLLDEVGVDPAMATFLLYVNASDTVISQVNSALRHVTNYNSTITTAITGRNLQLRPTYNLVDANGAPYDTRDAVMVLAGRENVYGDKLTPTAYQGEDIYSFSDAQTVEMSFAVGTANALQMRRGRLFA